MAPLAPPDTHHLDAARGWLGLGNSVEADAELERIPAELHGHPEVLAVRYEIYAKAENWAACADVANSILLADFNRTGALLKRSFALHKLGRTQEAFEHLETAVDLFPGNWQMHYDMARYACKMGRRREARICLERAIEAGDAKTIKPLALAEPDLEPLWAEIREI